VDRLVAATFAAAHSSLDMAIKTAIHLAVVAVQLTLIGVFFYEPARLAHAGAACRGRGTILAHHQVRLTFNDYASRSPSSPCRQPTFSAANVGLCASPVT
jgi:hypothetical protein